MSNGPLADFFKHWELSVLEFEKSAWEADKVAADFAKMALQAGILLNGAALTALPPLMGLVAQKAQWMIPGTAKHFAFGLFAALLGVATAYLNYGHIAASQFAQAKMNSRDLQLHASAQPGVAINLQADPEYASAQKKLKTSRFVCVVALWLAFGFGISSFVLLSCGVIDFIDLPLRPPASAANSH